MICPACEQEVDVTGEVFMLGNDRPYFNIYFHRDCFRRIFPEIEADKERWLPKLRKLYENSLKPSKKK